MTPAQWKVLLRIGVMFFLAACCIGSGFICAWVWQANAYGKQLAGLKSAHDTDLAMIARAGADQNRKALERQQAAEARAAAIDERYTKEKAHDLAENEKLRRAVADGTRRLRIAASCSAPDYGSRNLPGSAFAPGLGDAGTVELSGAAGRTVFDIRAGIIADRKALKALQDYVQSLGSLTKDSSGT